MKQQGKYISGDPVRVNNYTVNWPTVKLHPTTFYRRYNDLQEGLDEVRGFYTELDMGQYVVIRFSDKEDLTDFYRRHHSYI